MDQRPFKRCRHWHAVERGNPCELGVDQSKWQSRYGTLFVDICHVYDGDTSACPRYSPPTREEEAQALQHAKDAFIEFSEALAGGICPWCGATIAEREQVGRCVYARPCGCRLYQGRVEKRK